MFHLNWKDNLFLVGITLLMIFVALVFAATYKGVGVGNNYDTSVARDTNERSNVFDCRGDSFSINQPVSDFTFRDIQYESGNNVVKDCRWRALSNEYNILYLKVLDESQTDPESLINNFSPWISVDRSDRKFFRKTLNGFEEVVKAPDQNIYFIIKVMSFENNIYFLGKALLEITDLDNPSFRSFVDSFELIK
jgi:hypothetical protein